MWKLSGHSTLLAFSKNFGITLVTHHCWKNKKKLKEIFWDLHTLSTHHHLIHSHHFLSFTFSFKSPIFSSSKGCGCVNNEWRIIDNSWIYCDKVEVWMTNYTPWYLIDYFVIRIKLIQYWIRWEGCRVFKYQVMNICCLSWVLLRICIGRNFSNSNFIRLTEVDLIADFFWVVWARPSYFWVRKQIFWFAWQCRRCVGRFN